MRVQQLHHQHPPGSGQSITEGEIEEIRNMNAQLQQQIQMQEVRRNEELAVVLRAVNRNTGHI
jgi:hypothetical protein